MFDPVKLFEDIASARSMDFIYGAKPFLNWEITQKSLTTGKYFLAMFPFSETGTPHQGGIAEWEASTILWVGNKIDPVGTISSLDETEKQKYDRRLKTLAGLIKEVLGDLCACEDVEVVGKPRVFRELNRFDENTDVVGCELTFRYDKEADNTTIDFPVSQAGTAITNASFSTNWLASSGATGYYLDVATDELFAHKLTGYNNKAVGNVLTYPVTGLTTLTDYYYRVRAYDGTTSIDSAIIHVKTL